MDLEGVVSKRTDAPYISGRGDTWVKSKRRQPGGLIGGWQPEPHSPFKALLVGVYEPARFTYTRSLKTGLSASKDLLLRLRALETDASPFAGAPPRKTSEIHWVRPEMIAAAEVTERTASGKLRQGSFKGLREDNRPEEVVRERPLVGAR